MSLIVQLAGWLLVCIGAAHGMRMRSFDRQLQQFRRPDAPSRAFIFVPHRWKQELYTAEGGEFIGKAMYAQALMYVFLLLGMLLIALGSTSARAPAA